MALENSDSKNENSYEITDSIVEPLTAIRRKIRSRERKNRRIIIGGCLYLASLITRNRSFVGEEDTYKEGKRVNPVLEMRNYSRILWRYLNLIKSKNIPVNNISRRIKREIKKEEGKLEKSLEERGVSGVQRERVYYLVRELMGERDHLNGLYEELGEGIEETFLEDPEFRDNYVSFTKKYNGIAEEVRKRLRRQGAEENIIKSEIRSKSETTVAAKLGSQEGALVKLLKGVLEKENWN